MSLINPLAEYDHSDDPLPGARTKSGTLIKSCYSDFLNEINFMQPKTADWLTANGYSYEKEVDLPEYGRADFVAWKPDGSKIVVECKFRAGKSFGRAAAQVLDYARQVNAPAFIALPSTQISEYVRDVVRYFGINLISVEVGPYDVALACYLDSYYAFQDRVAECRTDDADAGEEACVWFVQNATRLIETAFLNLSFVDKNYGRFLHYLSVDVSNVTQKTFPELVQPIVLSIETFVCRDEIRMLVRETCEKLGGEEVFLSPPISIELHAQILRNIYLAAQELDRKIARLLDSDESSNR